MKNEALATSGSIKPNDQCFPSRRRHHNPAASSPSLHLHDTQAGGSGWWDVVMTAWWGWGEGRWWWVMVVMIKVKWVIIFILAFITAVLHLHNFNTTHRKSIHHHHHHHSSHHHLTTRITTPRKTSSSPPTHTRSSHEIKPTTLAPLLSVCLSVWKLSLSTLPVCVFTAVYLSAYLVCRRVWFVCCSRLRRITHTNRHTDKHTNRKTDENINTIINGRKKKTWEERWGVAKHHP